MNCREYFLDITPQTHVRSTQDESKCFQIFGHLYRIQEKTPAEQEALDRRAKKYWKLYKRFLQLERYNDYKRRLVAEAARNDFYLADAGMDITFYVPVSPSWRPGKKRKFDLQPHLYKPDNDNLMKSFLDALKPQQDSCIWHIGEVKKLWLNEPRGGILVECREILPKKAWDPRRRKSYQRK